MPLRFSIVVVSAVVVATACSSPTEGCSLDLSATVTPSQQSLPVGQSLTPTATAYGCSGTKALQDTWRWTTRDPGIVSVDSLTGRVTGRAPGAASVVATSQRYGAVVSVQVTVR